MRLRAGFEVARPAATVWDELTADDALHWCRILQDVRWTVVVRDLADKRGPAKVAQTLYEETEESKARREQRRLEHRYAARPLGADLGGRPTKQARRRLEALRKAQRRDDP